MGIRRRRAPEIKAPESKVKAIATDCRKKAREKGHDAEIWRLETTWGEMKCAKCGLTAGLALAPPPGADKFSGAMLEKECEG